ncbi:hypothetical protein XENOCAPTIV_013638 [Xenoophorus captivus]|uniref:C2H2-type domain-containing protein n=1 Tax=Xenoophorus captivus TaxID=1517983 RepID=A0ABV0R525_9TELE
MSVANTVSRLPITVKVLPVSFIEGERIGDRQKQSDREQDGPRQTQAEQESAQREAPGEEAETEAEPDLAASQGDDMQGGHPQALSDQNQQCEGQTKQIVVIDSSYQCQFCASKFKTYFQLKSHLTQHKGEQVYKCVLKSCSQTFQKLDHFLEHIRTHQEQLTYRCHLCSKVFPSLFELGVHQYSHCFCPQQNTRKETTVFRSGHPHGTHMGYSWYEHLCWFIPHHLYCVFLFRCVKCQNRRHLPTHGVGGRFRCQICKKAFKTEHYLKLHTLIHSGIKPYKCLFCQKAFSRRAHMLEHQQSHTDNYRFRCSTCNKGFTRQSYYRDHKCPTAGGGTGAEERTEEEEEGDEAAVVTALEEQEGERDGRRSRFTRKSKRSQTDGEDPVEEDCSEDAETQSGEEEEGEGTDEGCQGGIAITEEQTEREEHGRADTRGELQARTGSNAQMKLQRQPCL